MGHRATYKCKKCGLSASVSCGAYTEVVYVLKAARLVCCTYAVFRGFYLTTPYSKAEVPLELVCRQP